MTSTSQIDKAQRVVDAIDKRIDAVLAELHRVSGFDHNAFEYGTQEGYLAACIAATNVRRDFPGFDGFERSLYLRRHDARATRDEIEAKVEKAAKRKADRDFARESRARFIASRHSCPTCGFEHHSLAA